MNETIEISFNSIVADIKYHLKRANWDKEKVKQHLILNYLKDGLLKLNDIELLGFQAFCRELPSKSAISIEFPCFKRLEIKPLSISIIQ